MKRCFWTDDNELLTDYHDEEWGVPVHNDRKHFEFLLLEYFQAGLTRKMVLYRRENFRTVFDDYNYRKIARYNKQKVEELVQDERIIRNRLKIRATITNAQAFIAIRQEFERFDKYIWQFTDHKTIVNTYEAHEDIPESTPESDAMSMDLKKRGFKFVASPICYAYMQAAGMVNDHTTDCFRYKKLLKESEQDEKH